MSRELKKEAWPHWAYKNKREWKRDVRKKWVAFKKSFEAIRTGCAFHPTDFVYRLDIKDADRVFKNWYKKA